MKLFLSLILSALLSPAFAFAHSSDVSALEGALQRQFNTTLVDADTDLADLMMASDLMVREIYRGAGLRKPYFENGPRTYVMNRMALCRPVTLRCLADVLP